MKNLLTLKCALAALLATSLWSCSEDEPINYVTLNVANAEVTYDQQGHWTDCYNTSLGDITIDKFSFSHSATDWGGGMMSWTGFSPSRSTDKTDYTAQGSWLSHQWSSITGTGVAGSSYMVAFWNVSETTTAIPETPALRISYNNGTQFAPQSVCITNSSYGYYSMKNGSAYNHAFTASDWCKVTVIGVKDNTETARVEASLAEGTAILDSWKVIDLRSLGQVDAIYFQMSSSDSGQWGMNNAAYFCLDRLTIVPVEQ